MRQLGVPGHIRGQEERAGEGAAGRNKQGKCTVLQLIRYESRRRGRKGPQVTLGFGMGYADCF